MNSMKKDPMGQAIVDYAATKKNKDIIVSSDICEDDVISSAYLFRSYDEMPKLEQLALTLCTGKILDIGAGAGVHANYLQNQGQKIACIDTSPLAVSHLKAIGLEATCIDFFDFEDEIYDTLLLLMNGIGIAGELSNLERTLQKAKSLLRPGGKIVCDSSDIQYLYEDEDGGMWVDLNTTYYGNFNFQMKYGEHETDTFKWLYVDFENLQEIANKVGFEATIKYTENDQYLAELILVA